MLVEFEPEYFTSFYIKDTDDLKTVSDVVFDRLYWDKLDDGTITDDEVTTAIRNRLPERLQKDAVSAYENWIKNLKPIDGMTDILKELKSKGNKLLLLSNISKGFANSYKNVPHINDILSLFDGLVFSGPIGLVKPNKEIFEHLLEKYDIKAEESIFIDDNAANIKGAETSGIKGYLFDGDVEKLKKFIF